MKRKFQEAQRQRPASLSVKKPCFLRSASVQDASPVGRALTMSSFAASNKSIAKYCHHDHHRHHDHHNHHNHCRHHDHVDHHIHDHQVRCNPNPQLWSSLLSTFDTKRVLSALGNLE